MAFGAFVANHVFQGRDRVVVNHDRRGDYRQPPPIRKQPPARKLPGLPPKVPPPTVAPSPAPSKVQS